MEASPAERAWTVDTSTPDTTIDRRPPAFTPVADVELEFSSPDAGAGADFECQLDPDGPFAPCTSPLALTALAEGAHRFAVRVRDAGGNVDPSPALATWTVDLTAPETGIESGPVGAVANTIASFALNDYEWVLAFEADELHRIVDLMRELRASRARLHVREEVPFHTGRRVAVADLLASLR